MQFNGKVVIVTGGLGAIGKACALRFAREGAALVLADLTSEGSSDVIRSLLEAGAPGAIAIPCDVSREEDIVHVCETALSQFGAIDVIVNVAGMMIYKEIETLSVSDWTTVLNVNFLGAALFTREGFRRMKPGGTIVNVSSVHARQTSALVAPYAAAKAALESLTRSAGIEGAAKGIRANAVLPGAVDTPMLRASPNIQSGVEVLDEKDIGTPENIADAVAFLASPAAAFITGASLLVDGGRLAKL
jgi:NAD(P)-dependent dehydrogenase (short-subunit alcohol dehydrogenase family)